MFKIIASLLRWLSTFLQAVAIYVRPSRRKHFSAWYFARSIRYGRRMSQQEMRRLEKLFEQEILVPLEKIPVIIQTGAGNSKGEVINWIHQPKLA